MLVGVDDSGGQPAVTLAQDATVAEVCRALAKARTDAALLTGPGGEMTGIVTSIDLVRSVPASTEEFSLYFFIVTYLNQYRHSAYR